MDNLQIFGIFMTFAILQSVAAPTCPSIDCTCQEFEIASRIETRVVCNTGSNKGYIPVFRSFSPSISSLYLSGIELTVLGNESFRQLSTVREVYLYDNYLIRIEARAFSAIDHSIELLDLQHNKLRDLQFLTTHDFSRLRELLLRDNQLTSISPGSFTLLSALETLNLDENKFSGPLTFLRQPSLKALVHLNLDANELTEIAPEDFLYLTNLRSLLVNRNQLRNINFLSHYIFKQLQGISAANNHLTTIDPSLFANKKLMRWIDFSNNQLTNASFLSSCDLHKLEEIYLSSNSLTSLPLDSFRATSTLSIFMVDNNLLQTLPRCALMRFYHQLQTFDISNNPMVCDCYLSWVQLPHSIPTERHSECVNLEFKSSENYEVMSCPEQAPCVDFENCQSEYMIVNPGYAGFTGEMQRDYIYTSGPSNSAVSTDISSIYLTMTMVFTSRLWS